MGEKKDELKDSKDNDGSAALKEIGEINSTDIKTSLDNNESSKHTSEPETPDNSKEHLNKNKETSKEADPSLEKTEEQSITKLDTSSPKNLKEEIEAGRTGALGLKDMMN